MKYICMNGMCCRIIIIIITMMMMMVMRVMAIHVQSLRVPGWLAQSQCTLVVEIGSR